MAKSFHRELDVGRAQQGVLLASREFNRVVFGGTLIAAEWAHVVEIKFLRLPGQQTFLDLFRKRIGISRCAKRFVRQDSRRLVVSMPVAIRSLKARNQHVWPEGAN